ncbi:sigma-70 family RNA polymerase sigma factor [candidate division KSB1 bacterium]|nr:sigma-70 family RNA polymerase sigma factor [candidate division KSB1 bacterium]
MELEAEFKSVVTEYQEKVRNTCFRFVNHPDDADDLAQEVFIQVYESMHRFRGQAELSTWIYRIAVNKSLDFLRRKKRKKRFAQLVSLFGLVDEARDIPVPDGKDPHQELQTEERRQVLNWALDKLPENQRTAIILSKYEGFSTKEITSIMDTSITAVEGLVHRAKKNLQKSLHRYFETKVL